MKRPGVLEHLRGLFSAREAGLHGDAELLASFRRQRDEAAFAALVQRHGPMVLSVCLRLLHDAGDAEDAFQATFLVLARRAGDIGRPEQLGAWLYGVACRTAMKARGDLLRRRMREQPLVAEPVVEPPAELVWQELRPILDEELLRLPDKYRQPVVLCYLEGKTRREAAHLLGWPEGTVATRLHQARERLRQRLTRRGLALSAGVLAVALSQGLAPAAVPAGLAGATVKAAVSFVLGQAAAGLLSAPVVFLTKGVLQAMYVSKCKLVIAVMLGVGLVGLGTRQMVVSSPLAPPAATVAPAEPPAAEPKQPPADENDEALARAKQYLGKLQDKQKDAEERIRQLQEQLEKARQEALRLRDLAEAQRAVAEQQARLAEEQARRAVEAYNRALQQRTLQKATDDLEKAVQAIKETTKGNPDLKKAVSEFESAYEKLRGHLKLPVTPEKNESKPAKP
jgi:RNA polymerase sigma factor (sigma-70 family)